MNILNLIIEFPVVLSFIHSLALSFTQTFKRYRVQFEVQRRQVETCVQSTQKDGKLTADQALVKQAWERLSARVRYTIDFNYFYKKITTYKFMQLFFLSAAFGLASTAG